MSWCKHFLEALIKIEIKTIKCLFGHEESYDTIQTWLLAFHNH